MLATGQFRLLRDYIMSKLKNADSIRTTLHMHNNEDARIKNDSQKPDEESKNKWKFASKWLVKFMIFRLIGWVLKSAWSWLYSKVEKILEDIF